MKSHRESAHATPQSLPRRTAFAILAAGLFSMPVIPAMAATITVDTTDQLHPSKCTLAKAIASANNDSNQGLPGCSSGYGVDTIVLPANGTLALTVPLEYDRGLPAISDSLIIQGQGATITRPASATAMFGILRIAEQHINVEILDTTISGGRSTNSGGGITMQSPTTLTLTRSTITNNQAQLAGGGIHNHSGIIRIVDSVIVGNSARKTGGGLHNDDAALRMQHSQILDNDAGEAGGGIFISSQGFAAENNTAFIRNSIVSQNTSPKGGGLAIQNGAITATYNTFSDNKAGNGGAIHSSSSKTLVAYSTVVGNSVSDTGGGIQAVGGGVLSVANSTISGNFSAFAGAGIHDKNNAFVVLDGVTVTDNYADANGGGGLFLTDSTALLKRNIIAGNQSTFSSKSNDIRKFGVGGWVISTHNVFGHSGWQSQQAFEGFQPSSTDFDASSDANNVALDNIRSPTLANHGGFTVNHALPANSPAIDLAPGIDCAGLVDQRLVNRPKGEGCDAGSHEVGKNVAAVSLTQTISKNPLVQGDTATITLTVINDGPENASDVVLANTLPSIFMIKPQTIVSSRAECKEAPSGTLTCDPIGLNASGFGSDFNVSFDVVAVGAGTVTNTASVAMSEIDFDPDLENNSALLEITVAAPVSPCAKLDPTRTCTVNGVRGQLCVVTEGTNTIIGSGRRDVIVGGSGPDTIFGGAGDDLICAGGGDDVVHGGAGNDVLLGASGNDSLNGDTGEDMLDGGDGVDAADGGKGDDACTAETQISCER